jgi:hypothetical protein
MEYISVHHNQDHIDRHFKESLVVGSKFLQVSTEDKQALLDFIDIRLAARFQEMVSLGLPLGRVVLELEFNRIVGTNTLVQLRDNMESMDVIRDEGTANERVVKVVPVTKHQDIPMTSLVAVVAGPYDDKTWGIYTLFPGHAVVPFPNKEFHTAAQMKEYEAFWSQHAFLATQDEIHASGRIPSPPPFKGFMP